MNVERSVGRYLKAFVYTRAMLMSPSVMSPLLAFALLQGILVSLWVFFATPALAPVMVPVVRALAGETGLHYPGHLTGFPDAYRRVYVPLVATLGFSLWTLAAWRMVDRHRSARDLRVRPLAPLIPHVVMIGILFVGAEVIAAQLPARLVGPKTPAMLGRLLIGASLAVTAVVQAFLVYAPVVLRVHGGNVWSAVVRSAACARGRYLSSVLLVATVLVAHVPLDHILSNPDKLAARVNPELIPGLMLVSIVLEIFTACFLFAGATDMALPHEGAR